MFVVCLSSIRRDFPEVCLTTTGYATSEKKSRLDFTMEPRGIIKCSRHLPKPFESKASLSEKALSLCTLYFIYQGITPNDVQVVELHDCFSVNELLTYEGLGLCAEGKSVFVVVKISVSHR